MLHLKGRQFIHNSYHLKSSTTESLHFVFSLSISLPQLISTKPPYISLPQLKEKQDG